MSIKNDNSIGNSYEYRQFLLNNGNQLMNKYPLLKIQELDIQPAFSLSIEYFKNIFYYYFGFFINEGGRKEGLKFVCIVIILSVFLANIFRYLSSLVLAKIGVTIITNLRKKVYESS